MVAHIFHLVGFPFCPNVSSAFAFSIPGLELITIIGNFVSKKDPFSLSQPFVTTTGL